MSRGAGVIYGGNKITVTPRVFPQTLGYKKSKTAADNGFSHSTY